MEGKSSVSANDDGICFRSRAEDLKDCTWCCPAEIPMLERVHHLIVEDSFEQNVSKQIH